MQFFIVTLLAQRMSDTGIEAAVNTLIVIQESEQHARQDAERAMQERFPAGDGWKGHDISVFEVPEVLEDDKYKFTWAITPVTPAHT